MCDRCAHGVGGEGGRKGVLSLHMARYEHSFRLFLIDTIDCILACHTYIGVRCPFLRKACPFFPPSSK